MKKTETSVKRIRAWIQICTTALLLLTLSYPCLAAEPTIRPDPVQGSCENLKNHVASKGIQDAEGINYPNTWGITKPIFLINGMDSEGWFESGIASRMESPFEVTTFNRPGFGGTSSEVCMQASNFNIEFGAQVDVSAIEWEHNFRAGSTCANEWARLKAVIKVHELKHVKDAQDVWDSENQKIAKHPPVLGCGSTSDEANNRLREGLKNEIKASLRRMMADYKKKANALDSRETASIDCSLCKPISYPWHGTITYTETYHWSNSTNKPGKTPDRRPSVGDQVIQSVQESSESATEYTATVNVVAGAGAQGRQEGEVTSSATRISMHSSTTVAKIVCVPDRATPRIGSVQSVLTSGGTSNPLKAIIPVNISENHFEFRPPDVEIVVTGSESIIKKACGPSENPKPRPIKNVQTIGPQVRGKYVGTSIPQNPQSPDVLNGTKTETVGKDWTITYTWDLAR